jgi:surface antigen
VKRKNAAGLVCLAIVVPALGGCFGSNASEPVGATFLVDPAPAMRTPPPGAGATLGLVLATEIGKRFDDRDRILSAVAEYDALQSSPAGAALDWRNPATGRGGTVTPGAAYSVNQYTCRDYAHRVMADGKQEAVRGTACRQPDGSWRPLT